MGRYVLKRLALMPLMILIIMFIIFSLVNLVQTNPALSILGLDASIEDINALNDEMGFNDPLVLRYVRYVADALRGDLGSSYYTKRPVVSEVLYRLPNTLILTFGCIFVSILIGMPLGILCAVKQYSAYDNIASTVAILGGAIPSFWLGLVLLLVFSQNLGWFPAGGVSDGWRSWVLPIATVAAPYSAIYLRYCRSSMLDTIRQDYITTARSKGNKESEVIMRHAFKNALIPLVTITGLYIGGLMSSAVVVETIFSIPGLGLLVLNSIKTKDIPMVMGCILFLSVVFLVITLIMDVLYAYIDPRIKTLYNSAKKRKKYTEKEGE